MQLISILPLLPWVLVLLLPATATIQEAPLKGLQTATAEGD
jgi:hypothetical protein